MIRPSVPLATTVGGGAGRVCVVKNGGRGLGGAGSGGTTSHDRREVEELKQAKEKKVCKKTRYRVTKEGRAARRRAVAKLEQGPGAKWRYKRIEKRQTSSRGRGPGVDNKSTT